MAANSPPRGGEGCVCVCEGGRGSRLQVAAVGLSFRLFLPKELEQMAREQDKESEKQALLQEVENHKKQMLR